MFDPNRIQRVLHREITVILSRYILRSDIFFHKYTQNFSYRVSESQIRYGADIITKAIIMKLYLFVPDEYMYVLIYVIYGNLLLYSRHVSSPATWKSPSVRFTDIETIFCAVDDSNQPSLPRR